MYTIDSCFEKIRQNTNVCHRPSYRIVCQKPIVNRGLLTHDDYLKMLSTPKGYKWQKMTSYYNQVGQDSNMLNLKMANGNKKIQENENNGVHKTKKQNETNQQKMNNRKKSTEEKKMYNKENISNEQKQKGFDDSLSADANELGNILNKQLQTKELSGSNNKDEKKLIEKLKKIKADEELYLLMKKEQLWLQSEKKRKKQDKVKKIKSDLKTKQNAREEYKKKLDEMIKLKNKRKQTMEAKLKKEKSEKEKEEIVKKQALAERKMLEQQAELIKKAEQNLRLQALKLEAERIIEEEEEWRNKINQATALKMGYNFKPKQHNLSIENIRNENYTAKTGKKRFTQYIDNLLNEIKQNDQVFDSGNVMKQIIRKELNMGNKRQVKLKKQLSVCDEALFGNTKNTLTVKTKDGKDKYNIPKDIVIKTQYGTDSTIDCQNKICNKSIEHSVPQKTKKVLTCKIHNEHRYSTTMCNNIVCCWKNDIDRLTANMRNCQNFIQNSKDHNMWEQKIFK